MSTKHHLHIYGDFAKAWNRNIIDVYIKEKRREWGTPAGIAKRSENPLLTDTNEKRFYRKEAMILMR
jgi:hypothetical protein